MPLVEYAVEFDCTNGCALSVEEMVDAFQSSVRPSEVPLGGALDSCPAENPPAGDAPARRIHTMELIPGHAETTAEVWLWHGREEDGEEAHPSVSLRSDDWPMCPTTARRLAGALLAAAAIAERHHRNLDRDRCG